jgi:hypothetical protein
MQKVLDPFNGPIDIVRKAVTRCTVCNGARVLINTPHKLAQPFIEILNRCPGTPAGFFELAGVQKLLVLTNLRYHKNGLAQHHRFRHELMAGA